MTFFGCYEDAPTIVYIPNQMVTYASNVSTFKFVYSDAEIKVVPFLDLCERRAGTDAGDMDTCAAGPPI